MSIIGNAITYRQILYVWQLATIQYRQYGHHINKPGQVNKSLTMQSAKCVSCTRSVKWNSLYKCRAFKSFVDSPSSVLKLVEMVWLPMYN